MNKLYLSKNLTLLGGLALGAIATTTITTAPARAFTPDLFNALGWDNGTSQFYTEGFNAFDTVGDQFTITFCNPDEPEFDCGATIENIQGDFVSALPGVGVGDRIEVFSDPTVTWENVGIFVDPEFQAVADFELQDDLVFDFGGGVSATLPQGARIRGEIELDGGLEFELEGGINPQSEWEFTIPGMSATAQTSVFEFGITSENVNSGVYDAEGEFIVHTGVPEPVSILGLLVVGGLGMAMKYKKQS